MRLTRNNEDMVTQHNIIDPITPAVCSGPDDPMLSLRIQTSYINRCGRHLVPTKHGGHQTSIDAQSMY